MEAVTEGVGRSWGILVSGKRPGSLGPDLEKGLGQGWRTQAFAGPAELASPGSPQAPWLIS